MKTRQRTFSVNGEKITIKTRPRSYAGNHAGYNVFINDEKFFVNTLYRQEAEDKAFVKWVKNNK